MTSKCSNTMDSSTPAQKARQNQLLSSKKFKSEYQKEFVDHMIKKLNKGEEFFHCGLCKTDNSIGSIEITAITRHDKSKTHQDAKKAINSAAPINFFIKKGSSTSESDKNSIVETAISYHIVKHRQGFIQADCLNELMSRSFTFMYVNAFLQFQKYISQPCHRF